MKIYKYILELTTSQSIDIIGFEKVLDCQVQNGKICIWVLCDPLPARQANCPNPVKGQNFWIFGTGQDIDVDYMDILYLKTVQLDGYVWHVFKNIL